jgi:hypothetical protein
LKMNIHDHCQIRQVTGLNFARKLKPTSREGVAESEVVRLRFIKQASPAGLGTGKFEICNSA